MLNKSILVGRITRDLEVRYTKSGKAVGQTSIAVTRNFSSSNGETESDFIDIIIWGKHAETFATYTAKGNLVSVVGRIQTRSYENNSGKKVYVTEVIVEEFNFLEKKRSLNTETTKKSDLKNNQSNQPNQFAVSGNSEINISDDDLPF